MKKTIFLLILTAVCFKAIGQNKIRGTIVAEFTGHPLLGATVYINDTNLKTSTDTSGTFNFDTKLSKVTITVNFKGYVPTSVTMNAPYPSPLVITLKGDVRILNEVIISTGYENIPLDRSTGSFEQVDNKLYNRRVSSDVLSRLEGVVPGLLFNKNTNTAAGGAADITIRGTSTLFAASQPLIVLDGFPYDGDISNLDPNIVESVSILKDAAAASIWGVKSGNGVIVITTKHGSRNKPMTVELNANVTIGNRPDLYYNPNFLNSNDFIDLEQSLFKQGYYDGTLSTPYAIVSTVVSILAAQRNGNVSEASANSEINALRGIDIRNDLAKYFYRHSVDQQYALNLSGGGVNSDYFLAASFDNSLANLVGNASRRLTLNSSYNFYPTKNLTLSASVNISHSQTEGNSPVTNINGGGGYGIYPYAQIVGKNGSALPIVKDYASAYTDTVGSGKLVDWKYRPLDELRNADNTTTLLDNRINLSARYNFLSDFAAEVKYEYEIQKGELANNYSDQTYYTRNLFNQFTSVDASGNLVNVVPPGGILQSGNNSLVAQRARFQLDYKKAWAGLHELSVIAGTEINQTESTSDNQTVYGYNKSTLTYQNVDFADYFPTIPSGNYAQIPNSLFLGKFTDRYVSYYSNAGYTYLSKYSFSLSGRIDKSNLFGVNTNQKSVPLYSAGVSWDISKEKFYSLNWLPYVKLRITYGYNGNVDKNVAALTTFQQLSGAAYTGNPFAVIQSPGNPELRWERDRIINFGFDFTSRQNVLSGSFEYYLKRGLDLFGDSPIAPSTGFLSFRGNTADIKGSGLDLNLSAIIIRKTDIMWQSSFLLSHVLDKVTKYDAQLDALGFFEVGDGNAGSIYPLTNRPLYAIYSYKFAGLNYQTGDPQGFLNGAVSSDYAAIISSTTPANMLYNGPSRPTTFGSWRNTFTSHKLSLSFNIIYKLDYYFRRSSINYGSLFNSWIGNKDYNKRWQKPGDEAFTNVPSLPAIPLDQNRDTFYEFSSALVDKGDHIRLQDINLSYDLVSAAGRKNALFKRFQIYSYLNNVAILWRANHDGLDPDIFSGTLPLPRTLAFGFKATFN